MGTAFIEEKSFPQRKKLLPVHQRLAGVQIEQMNPVQVGFQHDRFVGPDDGSAANAVDGGEEAVDGFTHSAEFAKLGAGYGIRPY